MAAPTQADPPGELNPLGAFVAGMAASLAIAVPFGAISRLSARPMAALSFAGYGTVLLIAGNIARGLIAR